MRPSLFHFLSLLLLPLTQAIIVRDDVHNPEQDIVTWDEHSLFIRGERVVVLSGEFHPWRLPSPGLWLDVFQKIKALGYNAVSFYVNWALVEGTPGDVRMDDVFDLQPFIDAGAEAGLYLIARPGPYVNSELSGGGFPGWLQRVKGELRSMAPDYINATSNYVSKVLDVISAAQITRGGPVVLVQPENEYTLAVGGDSLGDSSKLLDPKYMEFMKTQFRENGIELPLIVNDAVPLGNWAPGTGEGELDIYAHDAYPLYSSCADPTDWSTLSSLTYTYQNHLRQSPSTPYSVLEYQGGAPDPWGGAGVDKCAAKINQEFARVFVKELVSRSIKILNMYMTYGGTNWGNMGHPEGYTSYDHGAVIRENRGVDREKYSQAKIQSHWLHASEAYLTAIPQENTTTEFVSTPELQVVPIVGNVTRFYYVRHVDYASYNLTSYTFSVPTSHGNVTIPVMGEQLSLHGRDSKIHVTDYDVGGVNLVYSSAEIFTWKKYGNKTLLILYGGDDEEHEFAVASSLGEPSFENGDCVTTCEVDQLRVVHWSVKDTRQVVRFGDLEIHLLWRNDAYNHWILDLPDAATGQLSARQSKTPIVAKGPYLLRNATFSNNTLHLTGDLNQTTTLEVLGGVPEGSALSFNGLAVESLLWNNGRLKANLAFQEPSFTLPNLSTLEWRSIDSFPEVQPDYNDSAWTTASLTQSNNPRNLTTPTSLYCSDYGFNGGSLIYRGHFTAAGNESFFSVNTAGGQAYGHSVWLDGTFLGSFAGDPHTTNYTQQFELPPLEAATNHVFTVVIDHMGMPMNFYVHSEAMKTPRGILNYDLDGHSQSDVTWKLTGNFGGEKYVDKTRGPLNEGAMYAERQGYHLPGAPSSNWTVVSPLEGISNAGIAFYTTTFELDIPGGYDIPLSFVFENVTTSEGRPVVFRAQLFINGYQFGEYINHLGPQTRYPVPEGVLNYNGDNTVALTLWAFEETGARLQGFNLSADHVLQSGYRKPRQTKQPAWEQRTGVY
ncbi:beta-galactosidase [Colletotrichum karsti]|uniref:Beta-galactosidase n=1 Tax=Colletotrichum karsti TaxID=1095194 RepID=A0A9P6I8X8_9PEZI|nr:beta-galactosidase [Colletotrichum karsti]KAF9878523.1 beta-galactosidase [Colletotrichum karsti]